MVVRRCLAVLGIAAGLLAMVGSVRAELIDVTLPGTIREVRNPGGYRIGSTVDQWHFSVAGTTTEVSIDALSWEAEAPNSADEYPYVELVGQGSPEPAFFDTWIYLFDADPDGNPWI